jgi:dipeptidyl aminopeptidase/acylaminoacyl peptidase
MADPITLAALRAFVNLTDPRISPNGARVAYVRTVRDFVRDRDVAAIVVAGSDGRTRTLVDAGPFVSAPRWSPDGTRLAYLRHTGTHHEDQIVVVNLAAGSKRAVTDAPNGVQHYAWSPDGTRFVYDTPDDEPNAAAARRNDDLFDVGDDGFLTTKPPVPSHLWLAGTAGGPARRLTHGTWSVFEGSAAFEGGTDDPSWSADGRTILIDRAADAHTAATDRTSIAAVDVATGAVRDLGTVRQYVYYPRFAPSGARYAYVRPHGPGPVSEDDAVIVSQTGESNRTGALDRDVLEIRWSGDTLVALVQDHVLGKIVIDSPAGMQRFNAGRLSVESFDAAAGRRFAFVADAYGVPPELYVARGLHGTPHAITHENTALRHYDYGHADRIEWTASDGERSEGVVIVPPRARPGVRYPLLLWMHGGPEGESSGLGFNQQYPGGYDAGIPAAANGWYAFFPNYRGGNDFGNAHEHAIFRDPGEGPARDVLAGLAEVERRYPVDPKREAIGGHSYGGYMTAWIIGHDTRWKCAVVANGAVDLVAGYALSGDGNLSWQRDSLGGTPAQIPQLYHDGSPMTYADAVRTPTLIVTGLADDEAPFTESWEFFHALRDRHVPVRLVAIPTAFHTPADPVRLEAYYKTMFDWFAAHLEP